jgi:hypothetical protein
VVKGIRCGLNRTHAVMVVPNVTRLVTSLVSAVVIPGPSLICNLCLHLLHYLVCRVLV